MFFSVNRTKVKSYEYIATFALLQDIRLSIKILQFRFPVLNVSNNFKKPIFLFIEAIKWN